MLQAGFAERAEMLSPIEWVYCIALLVVTAVCVFGALSPQYEDTLMQHVGMATTAFGALAEVWLTFHGLERLQGASIFAVGVSIFALGTVLKRLPTSDRFTRYIKN